MHEEQTFIDDFAYSNAVGGGILRDYKDNSKTSLVGIDFTTSNFGKLSQFFNSKQLSELIKSQTRLNTLFSRLRYETNSVQRTAIIKEIEEIRPKVIDSIKDFDKISERLRAMLFVDLSKPIRFKVIPKSILGNPEFVIPINVDASTPVPIIDKGTPTQSGGGIVVAPPFDPSKVMVGEFKPVGGGSAPTQDEPIDSMDESAERIEKAKPSEEAKPKSKIATYILIVAAAVGLGYVLFKKK